MGNSDGFWKWVAELLVSAGGWFLAVIIWQVKPSNAQVAKMIEAALVAFAKADLDMDILRMAEVKSDIAGIKLLMASEAANSQIGYNSIMQVLDSTKEDIRALNSTLLRGLAK